MFENTGNYFAFQWANPRLKYHNKKIDNSMKVFILALMIFGAVFSQTCGGFNGADLLTSGQHIFSVSSFGGSRTHSYQTPVPYQIPSHGIQVAISTSTIAGFNPTSGFEYQIRGERMGATNNLLITLVIANDGSWISIAASYLVSSRTDFSLGSVLVDSFEWVYQGDGTVLANKPIADSNLQSDTQYGVAVFISGLFTDATPFQLNLLDDSFFDSGSKTLVIHFSPRSNPLIEEITFSYVIYPKVHQIFNFVIDNTPDGDASYSISGPNQFQPRDLQYYEFEIQNRFVPCNGGGACTNQCIAKEDCLAQNGHLYQNQCYFCALGVIFQAGRCTTRCGPNQFYFNGVCLCADGYDRQGNDCVFVIPDCGVNQIWNVDQCVCLPGYAKYEGECRACAANSSPNDDQTSCVCNDATSTYFVDINLCCVENSLPEGGACECIYGYHWVGGACEERCPENEVWKDEQCICAEGFTRHEGECRLCPDGSHPDIEQAVCICNSDLAIYNPIDNTCGECPPKSYPNDIKTSCQCIPFHDFNGYGECEPNCPALEEYSEATARCECIAGYERVDEVCVPECGLNEIRVEGVCVCEDNYIPYQGFCRVCPPGSAPNADLTSCECTLPTDTYYVESNLCCTDYSEPNAAGSSCQCQSGYTFNAGFCVYNCGLHEVWQGGECICVPGYAIYEGVCRICAANSSPNNDQTSCVCNDATSTYFVDPNLCCVQNSLPDGGACECIYGYHWVGGACEERCPENEVWKDEQCICAEGFTRHEGECRLCPDGSHPDIEQAVCICNSDLAIYNPIDNTCGECPPKSYPNDIKTSCQCIPFHDFNGYGECEPNCPALEEYSEATARCECIAGYERVDEVCVPECGLNEIRVDGVCVCENNYIPYQGFCRVCPPGSAPNADLTSCVCDSDVALYNPVLNVCQMCPEYSSVNADQTACTCLPGYEMIGGECVLICGENEEWLGGECTCITGYAYHNSVCRLCPVNSLPSASKDTCVCFSLSEVYDSILNTCDVCPEKSVPNSDRTGCDCIAFHAKVGGQCVATCGVNEEYSDIEESCVCKYGFMKLGSICVNRCGINQQWNGETCVCILGHAMIDGVCRPCPATSAPNAAGTTCICSFNNQVFNSDRRICEECPAFSAPNALKSECVCRPGYQMQGNACVQVIFCPNFAQLNQEGECECINGYYNDDGVCREQPECPANAEWNTRRLKCECTLPGEYLQGRSCRPCGANEVWNGQRCECIQDHYKIFGICRTCDPNSSFDGLDCVCNHGYYGDRDLCERCHSTCGACTGPGANQCTECVDITRVLDQGYCIQPAPCLPGFFLEGTVCQKCGDYCNDCDNSFTCNSCADGFQIVSQSFQGQAVSYCLEICGDGRRFDDFCDDGNNDNGDGCTDNCLVEEGWTCIGGTSSRRSTCLELIPENSVIQPRGAVRSAGKVLQSIRMSYLPTCVTNNNCGRCHEVLDVKVVDSLVSALSVKVNYILSSKYQFLVEFDFGTPLVSGYFTYVVKINEKFRSQIGEGCFSEEDFNQQIQWFVEPADLATNDDEESLSFDDIDSGNV